MQPLEPTSEWARMAQDLASKAGCSQLRPLDLALVVHVAMVHDDWDTVPQLVSFSAPVRG